MVLLARLKDLAAYREHAILHLGLYWGWKLLLSQDTYVHSQLPDLRAIRGKESCVFYVA